MSNFWHKCIWQQVKTTDRENRAANVACSSIKKKPKTNINQVFSQWVKSHHTSFGILVIVKMYIKFSSLYYIHSYKWRQALWRLIFVMWLYDPGNYSVSKTFNFELIYLNSSFWRACFCLHCAVGVKAASCKAWWIRFRLFRYFVAGLVSAFHFWDLDIHFFFPKMWK